MWLLRLHSLLWQENSGKTLKWATPPLAPKKPRDFPEHPVWAFSRPFLELLYKLQKTV